MVMVVVVVQIRCRHGCCRSTSTPVPGLETACQPSATGANRDKAERTRFLLGIFVPSVNCALCFAVTAVAEVGLA